METFHISFDQYSIHISLFATLPICPVLHSSERFLLLAGGSLEISDITEDDAGTYACIVDNGNETIEAQADLTVQGM